MTNSPKFNSGCIGGCRVADPVLKTGDIHQTTEATPLKPLVVEVKKEAPIVKIASYHHPHHPARQQPFRKECGHQQSYGPRWKHTRYR